MHGNINPDIVVVMGAGTWKLMGFNFSCYSQYQSDSTVSGEGGRVCTYVQCVSGESGRVKEREGGLVEDEW